ncbi:serine hydrolase [Streptococcus sp. 20-1249]|uniref:serine hydrolase n=1 Tax=Streptococcus hepaticus TaxID=3349163 RepID=UPI003749FFC0
MDKIIHRWLYFALASLVGIMLLGSSHFVAAREVSNGGTESATQPSSSVPVEAVEADEITVAVELEEDSTSDQDAEGTTVTNPDTMESSSQEEPALTSDDSVPVPSSDTGDSSTPSPATESEKNEEESATLAKEIESKPVYRLYNSQNGEHLYTTDANEKTVLYEKHGWGYEGIAWFAPVEGVPVYRLYNRGLQNHLYTTDTNEVNVLTLQHGWTKDNNGRPVFYSGGEVSIYRIYNQVLRGLHHWTTDKNEYNILRQHGWRQEGVKFQAVRLGQPIRTQYAADEALAAQIKSIGGYQIDYDTKKDLLKAIRSIQNVGYQLGFIMVDVRTKQGLEFNADQKFYAASTVKGPFVASLAAKNPMSIRYSKAMMQSVLQYSSNEGYWSLRVDTYGDSSLRAWTREAGVRESVVDALYPYYSSRELHKLWQRNYTYFTNGKTGQQVGTWFENPNLSPIKSVLGDQYRTQSKAGWIAYPGYHAASDAGIVYAKSGPYILAIMTDADAQLYRLNPVVTALHKAQSKIK